MTEKEFRKYLARRKRQRERLRSELKELTSVCLMMVILATVVAGILSSASIKVTSYFYALIGMLIGAAVGFAIIARATPPISEELLDKFTASNVAKYAVLGDRFLFFRSCYYIDLEDDQEEV